MSLTVIKAGVLDTLQDLGRYGFQHLGINPAGAMDRFSAALSNCLLGKPMNAPVIECHFPASKLRFDEATIITITGANFNPVVDGTKIPLCRPVVFNKNTLLELKGLKQGARCYLSFLHHPDATRWLGSFSTNLKAAVGGIQGRQLLSGDVIAFKNKLPISKFLNGRQVVILPWFAAPVNTGSVSRIEVIKGKEWNWLSKKSQEAFVNNTFTITPSADRMGYRLKGIKLDLAYERQLVSSGVSFGSIQLLPNKQLIILMADHQTTGGYPVIANIISSHLPLVAQMKPNEKIAFTTTDHRKAEKKWLLDYHYLLSVQHASSFKINKLIE